MSISELPNIYALRRVGSELREIKLEDDEHCLSRYLGNYGLNKGSKLENIPADAELILYAENFDPFAADTRHLANRIQTLEFLLEHTNAQIVLRTSSPLVLLATPILKNPRINLLYLLNLDQLQARRLAESIASIRTLCEVGIKVSIYIDSGLQQVCMRDKRLRQRLNELRKCSLEFLSPLLKKHSSSSIGFHLQNWLLNCLLDLDTRDAA